MELRDLHFNSNLFLLLTLLSSSRLCITGPWNIQQQNFLRDLLKEAKKINDVSEDKLIEYTDTMVSEWWRMCLEKGFRNYLQNNTVAVHAPGDIYNFHKNVFLWEFLKHHNWH